MESALFFLPNSVGDFLLERNLISMDLMMVSNVEEVPFAFLLVLESGDVDFSIPCVVSIRRIFHPYKSSSSVCHANIQQLMVESITHRTCRRMTKDTVPKNSLKSFPLSNLVRVVVKYTLSSLH